MIHTGRRFIPCGQRRLELSWFDDHEKKKGKFKKSHEFDEAFDNGQDITEELDLKNAQRPGLKSKRVNVDFPEWMIQMLDRESKKLGITRQSIIKDWIAEKLKTMQRPN